MVIRPKNIQLQIDENANFWHHHRAMRLHYKESKTGWIYCIRSCESPRCKIGITATGSRKDIESIDSRLSNIQTGNPERLVLSGLIKGTELDEMFIQWRFRHFNIRAEWFDWELPGSKCPGSIISQFFMAHGDWSEYGVLAYDEDENDVGVEKTKWQDVVRANKVVKYPRHQSDDEGDLITQNNRLDEPMTGKRQFELTTYMGLIAQ